MRPDPALVRPQPGADTLKAVRWGGARLAALRGGPEHAGVAIGESWELSTMPGHESRACDRPLSEVLGGPLPFLVKLIDTASPLSVQVHPDDAFTPGQPGKEEAWVILDAADDATLLCGVRDGVDPEALADAVARANASPDHDAVLIDRLCSIPVRAGMCIVVPAGTIHAIGAGILLMEIQQPVDRTFRLYDYGSGRPLHTAQALAAADLRARPVVWDPSAPPREISGSHVRLFASRTDAALEVEDAPQVVVVVSGAITVQAGGQREELRAGDLLLVRSDATVSADPGALWVKAGLAIA